MNEPEDRDSLVETVRRVLEDGELRARLGGGARATAETRDWEAATRALRRYYEMALAAR